MKDSPPDLGGAKLNIDCMLRIEKPESMNLLGLILASMIKKNLENQENSRLVEKLSSSINIKAGRMKANLRFKDGEILIGRGFSNNADASVSGTLVAFIDIGLKRNLLSRFFKGHVKIGGNVFKLLPLLKLLSI